MLESKEITAEAQNTWMHLKPLVFFITNVWVWPSPLSQSWALHILRHWKMQSPQQMQKLTWEVEIDIAFFDIEGQHQSWSAKTQLAKSGIHNPHSADTGYMWTFPLLTTSYQWQRQQQVKQFTFFIFTTVLYLTMTPSMNSSLQDDSHPLV